VKGMGPFSFSGSSDDSGACCQPDVQARKPCLFCQLASRSYSESNAYSSFLTSSIGRAAVLLMTGRLRSLTICILCSSP